MMKPLHLPHSAWKRRTSMLRALFICAYLLYGTTCSDPRHEIPPVFRLGSGAVPSTHFLEPLRAKGSGELAAVPPPRPSTSSSSRPWSLWFTHNEQYVPLYCFVSMYYIICCMVPGHGRGQHHAPHHGQPQLSNSSFNYRLPPAWAPEMETQYSFRAWTADLVLWSNSRT